MKQQQARIQAHQAQQAAAAQAQAQAQGIPQVRRRFCRKIKRDFLSQ